MVRSWLELSENPESYFVLREDREDPSTETRIRLHRGMQILIDTERLYHVVWHPGPAARYSLITSWESGPALRRWVASLMPEPVG